MPFILHFLLRLLMLAAGVVFAASLAVLFVVVLTLWSVRTAWARLTGRRAAPFVMRFRPAEGFRRAYRQPAPVRSVGDVTDVEVKRYS